MAADVLPDAATPFGQRVRERLRDDEVIWVALRVTITSVRGLYTRAT
jgi:hypothetical protein